MRYYPMETDPNISKEELDDDSLHWDDETWREFLTTIELEDPPEYDIPIECDYDP